MWAAENGHTDVVQVLAEAGADLDAVNSVCIFYLKKYIFIILRYEKVMCLSI